MKKHTLALKIVMILLGLGLNSQALSQELQFTTIEARGTGCPEGSTSIVLSPDNKSVSLLFSEMVAQVPNLTGDNDNYDASDDQHIQTSRFDRKLSRKACHIAINAALPEGHRLDAVEISVDFRGNTFMEEGTQALFNSRLLEFNGPRGQAVRAKNVVARQVWRSGAHDNDWTISNSKRIQLGGNCSQRQDRQIQLILDNVLMAGIRPEFAAFEPSAMVSLDSADVKGQLKVLLFTSPCHGGGGGGGINPPVPPTPGVCPPGYRWHPVHRACFPYGGPIRRAPRF